MLFLLVIFFQTYYLIYIMLFIYYFDFYVVEFRYVIPNAVLKASTSTTFSYHVKCFQIDWSNKTKES